MMDDDERLKQDLFILNLAGLRPTRSCVDCRRSWVDDKVHCGASPDENPPPIWGTIKYSLVGLLAALAGNPLENTDCEDLEPDAAERCLAYVEKTGEPTSAPHQEGIAKGFPKKQVG